MLEKFDRRDDRLLVGVWPGRDESVGERPLGPAGLSSQ